MSFGRELRALLSDLHEAGLGEAGASEALVDAAYAWLEAAMEFADAGELLLAGDAGAAEGVALDGKRALERTASSVPIQTIGAVLVERLREVSAA